MKNTDLTHTDLVEAAALMAERLLNSEHAVFDLSQRLAAAQGEVAALRGVLEYSESAPGSSDPRGCTHVRAAYSPSHPLLGDKRDGLALPLLGGSADCDREPMKPTPTRRLPPRRC